MATRNTIKKKWRLSAKIPDTSRQQLRKYSALVAQLLFNRGFKNPAEAEIFFNPDYRLLKSPFILSGMVGAVNRLAQAIVAGEKITIYADYDADAVTACSVLYRGLGVIGAKTINYYIPDRFSEGYGVNGNAIEEIAKNGTKLIVTVDCGINSIEEVKRANQLGVDVIITDHHHITDGLPEACAVVNHHRDKIPELSGLTGVGTAFKLLQALLFSLFPEKYEEQNWEWPKDLDKKMLQSVRENLNGDVWPHWEKWVLDLVAIGTIADCQSVMGENRTLVKFGLAVLQKTRWIGLRQLLVSAGLNNGRQLDTFSIGFVIAPRINAASRIQHADIAFKLLTTNDLDEAGILSGQLESLNQHRQRLTEQIFSEARAQVELQSGNKALVAVGDGWPKGVIGLVASRLSEEFHRPVVVLERSGELASGSARSIENFNLVDALKASASSLTRYGGHAGAAGLTLKHINLPMFQKQLLGFAENKLQPEDLVRHVAVEALVEPSDLSLEVVETLQQFEPFGPGNVQPKFLLEDITVESVREVGNTGKHLRLQASKAGVVFSLIGFGYGPRKAQLAPGLKIDAVIEASVNVWNGRRDVQRKLMDFRVKV